MTECEHPVLWRGVQTTCGKRPAILFYYNSRLDQLMCRCADHPVTVIKDAADWKCVSEAEAMVILVHQL